jgi:hypothetical protein
MNQGPTIAEMIRHDVRETLLVAAIASVLWLVVAVEFLGEREALMRDARRALQDARARASRLREGFLRAWTRPKREGRVVKPNSGRALPYDG